MDRRSRRQNLQGIVAWLNPYRYNLERWAYTLQRITGVGILLYFVGHILETGTILGGPDAWETTLNITQTPSGHTILLLLILAIGYHGLNGIRLTLTEFGVILGRPQRPDYPYRPKSLNTSQRIFLWFTIIITIIATIYGFTFLFQGE